MMSSMLERPARRWLWPAWMEGAASREEKVAGWEVPAAVWNLPTASREEKTAWDLATASREEAAAMG